jgi:hypothetical protein
MGSMPFPVQRMVDVLHVCCTGFRLTVARLSLPTRRLTDTRDQPGRDSCEVTSAVNAPAQRDRPTSNGASQAGEALGRRGDADRIDIGESDAQVLVLSGAEVAARQREDATLDGEPLGDGLGGLA